MNLSVQKRPNQGDAGHEVADLGYEPYRLLEQQETSDQIQSALGQLPERAADGRRAPRHRGYALRRDRAS